MPNPQSARRDAVAIWWAGVHAARGDVLVGDHLQIRHRRLQCREFSAPLDNVRRVLVLGAGKATAAMTRGLANRFAQSDFADLPMVGWVNVPDHHAGSMGNIELHASRPFGRNEPTAAGVAGARHILNLAHAATERDLIVCLVSGGASALMPLPVEGISWQQKRAVTQRMTDAGANIWELNMVRKQLSAIKGGKLGRACRPAQVLTLIISDVLGDPLDVIASGPTVVDKSTAADALATLCRLVDVQQVPPPVIDFLNRKRDATDTTASSDDTLTNVTHHVLANNDTAIMAARAHAAALGYPTVVMPTEPDEGTADEVAARLLAVVNQQPPGTCILSGGEPTVRLCNSAIRGIGGRNQQLVLAALVQILSARHSSNRVTPPAVLISAGTDGEDGPTDAAGSLLDARLLAQAQLHEAQIALQRNDAYPFFAEHNALFKANATDTNVCDLRILIT